ncbi:MAG: phosphotransferase [Balneolaceae bacterium]|jgi:5-methylthioribose kinase
MPLSREQILSVISQNVPDFSTTSELQPLPGGNLNHVWRLEGKSKSMIIKYSPPYIASNPEVPLGPKRIHFEARALKLFEKNGPLHIISSDEIRPPHIIFFNSDLYLLVMEDVSTFSEITNWLVDDPGISKVAHTLGRFIGLLHANTFQHEEFKNAFDNSDIQQTRLKVQYQPAKDYARQSGISNTEYIHSKTVALGRKLRSPGCCLVMGDLWPPSVLVSNDEIRLIDWEFAHYGHPLQDVAHFAAHCWMQAHVSPKEKKPKYRDLWEGFWETYQEATGESFSHLFDEEAFNDAATHIGAEILVRAAGPFKDGYVYQGLSRSHTLIREAGLKAQSLILANDFSSLWQSMK